MREAVVGADIAKDAGAGLLEKNLVRGKSIVRFFFGVVGVLLLLGGGIDSCLMPVRWGVTAGDDTTDIGGVAGGLSRRPSARKGVSGVEGGMIVFGPNKSVKRVECFAVLQRSIALSSAPRKRQREFCVNWRRRSFCVAMEATVSALSAKSLCD